MAVLDRIQTTIQQHGLATSRTPVLLMVSGGLDSVALSYLARELKDAGVLGSVGLVHINHLLRGSDSDKDEAFARRLAAKLDFECFVERIDVGAIAAQEHGNLEAVARRERYQAARRALQSFCQQMSADAHDGRLFTAHTADDRLENFYMRSIVGTGPGGFRSMRYLNGDIARPLLDCTRDDLHKYLIERAEAQEALCDDDGMLWREDLSNASTEQFRAYVRHELLPIAKKRNAQLAATLGRTMNLIADEDDYLEAQAEKLAQKHLSWLTPSDQGCVFAPEFSQEALPLQRRVVFKVLKKLLGDEERVEYRSVSCVLEALANSVQKKQSVQNIQGNLVVCASSKGVRVETIQSYQARKKGSGPASSW